MRTTCLVASAALALNGAAHATDTWTVVNLHPAGKGESEALGTCDGSQVGYAIVGNMLHASLWGGSAASWIDLHPADATGYSRANAVSGVRQAGFATYDSNQHAMIWSGTAASRVDLHPAGLASWASSEALGIDGTQVVGWVNDGYAQHANLWSILGTRVDLHPAGASWSQALGVSGSTQVGIASIEGMTRASLWSGDASTWVDLHPSGAYAYGYSYAYAASGTQQVGIARVFVNGLWGPELVDHAALWNGTAESWVDLHPVGRSGASTALATSGTQQVGSCGGRASLWTGTAASWVDLAALLPGSWGESTATGISSDGTNVFITGHGYNSNSGKFEALLWIGPAPVGCVGDVDGSDSIDQGDVALILLDYGPCAGCPTDLDGTGEVDFGDVALALLSSGPCG